MARSVLHSAAVVSLATALIGLAAPTTADGESTAGLPPCPAAPPGAADATAPTTVPSRVDPAACRARATRVEPASGRLPVPEPGYHHLGGTTSGQWSGVMGRLGVRDTGVRTDTFDFVAARFMAKRGDGAGGTDWLEVGWTDAGWSGDGTPRIYTFDSDGMSWVFYDEYELREGDQVWIYLHSDGPTWQAWLWWDERWQLLAAPEAVSLGTRARVEQYVEVHLDPAQDGPVSVPPVPVDGVHLQAEPGGELQRWRDQVPTVVPDGPDDYCLVWQQRFDDWSAGDCSD